MNCLLCDFTTADIGQMSAHIDNQHGQLELDIPDITLRYPFEAMGYPSDRANRRRSNDRRGA